MTTSVTSAILSANYFCLVSYISSDVTSQKFMTALKSLLVVVSCRVTLHITALVDVLCCGPKSLPVHSFNVLIFQSSGTVSNYFS